MECFRHAEPFLEPNYKVIVEFNTYVACGCIYIAKICIANLQQLFSSQVLKKIQKKITTAFSFLSPSGRHVTLGCQRTASIAFSAHTHALSGRICEMYPGSCAFNRRLIKLNRPKIY